MKKTWTRPLLVTAAYLCIFQMAAPVSAQQLLQPLPDPVIGLIPVAPANAQEAHDEVSIGQLMKVVELARSIGGGITQIFNTIVTQTAALEKMRDAQTGPKQLPNTTDANDETGRDGGEGLNEMAKGLLAGAVTAPRTMTDAITKFRETYSLDKAFAFQNDDSKSKVFVANAAAQGAIASATAETSYKRANDSMGRIGSYISAVEKSPDLKTSVDINTRVMIELTQQINESLRTQSAIASMAGTYFMIIGGEQGEDDVLSGLLNFNR